ncbi:MAG: type VI secretion system baseplate subunit TssG, partial [Nitrospirota bacterium]
MPRQISRQGQNRYPVKTAIPWRKRVPESFKSAVDLFNSDNLDYYVELRLRQEEVPPLNLVSPTALLGWSTWLGKKPDTDQDV